MNTENLTQTIQMVDLKSQYARLKPEIDVAIQNVIDSAGFINGQDVKEFSDDLADYLNVKHVIPCANGTDALQVALMALNLQRGDEVITTPFTFIATVEVIALLGLKPVFIDISPDTFNLDPDLIENAISDKTKVIMPVHLYGQSAEMEKIMTIAKKHNLKVIEDNAQAIGGSYTFSDGKQQKNGTIGDIGCTSFFPSKNLGCFGDGGAIFTNDDTLAGKIKIIVNHGSKVRYYHDVIGVNSRLDSIQAAILKVKLKQLDDFCNRRRLAADIYDQLLSEVEGITTPFRAPYSHHVFHQYTIKTDNNRNELHEFLTSNGIPNMIYYPVPLHLQKAFQTLGYGEGKFAVTEALNEQVLSLPMHTELTEDQQTFICNAIKEFTEK